MFCLFVVVLLFVGVGFFVVVYCMFFASSFFFLFFLGGWVFLECVNYRQGCIFCFVLSFLCHLCVCVCVNIFAAHITVNKLCQSVLLNNTRVVVVVIINK